MKNIEVKFPQELFDSDVAEPVPVRVVGVYDDESAYVAATHQLLLIASRCEACRFDTIWWSFNSLAELAVREAAMRAVADANMIWCASCRFRALPDTVKAWMEDWSERTHKPDAALVALLGCPLAGDVVQSPTRLCLYRAAQAAGMKFFEKHFHFVDARLAADYARAGICSPVETLAGLRGPDFPQVHWGINE